MFLNIGLHLETSLLGLLEYEIYREPPSQHLDGILPGPSIHILFWDHEVTDVDMHARTDFQISQSVVWISEKNHECNGSRTFESQLPRF